MNNQIKLRFSYINHQVNEPLNDENIISELNPVVSDVRTTPQFFIDSSQVNPYQDGEYPATIWCQVGSQKVEQTFKIYVKDFNHLNVNQTSTSQNQNLSQASYPNQPRKTSTAKKIWIGILIFVLIVLGLTSCSIYNQAKANQSQNQQLKNELSQVKAAQKTYQENHDKEELNNSLSAIQSQLGNMQGNNSDAIRDLNSDLNNRINSIQNNPDANNIQSELNNMKDQITSNNNLFHTLTESVNSLISSINNLFH